MTMNFRTMNAFTTAKVETTKGVDAAPVVADNTIRGEAPDWAPAFETEQTNFARGSITQSPPIVSGGSAKISIKSALMGSASAGTAAPDIGTYFRGCAMSETLMAADVSGTAQAGAAGTITVAASGTSATDNAYRGWVIETTGGTGPGQRRVVKSYNGTSKVAAVYPDWTVTPDVTTTYTIRKGAQYQPVTEGQESLTLYAYLRNSVAGDDARLRKVLGAMGAYEITIAPKKIARVTFNFTGIFPGAPTDVSDPGLGVFAGVDPIPYQAAQTYLGGVPVKFNNFTLSSGNQVANFDDPSAAYGNDTSEIVSRTATGKITPALSMVATMDAITDWITSTSKPLWLCWGSAGKGVSIYIPALRYTGNQPGDAGGFAVEDLPFQLTGDDMEVLITFF